MITAAHPSTAVATRRVESDTQSFGCREHEIQSWANWILSETSWVGALCRERHLSTRVLLCSVDDTYLYNRGGREMETHLHPLTFASPWVTGHGLDILKT